MAVVEHPPRALRPQPGPPEPEPPPKRKDALAETWTDPQGFLGWFGTVQNGPIVNRLMTTVFGFFLLGGIEALAMRTQLARPENTVLTPDRYNQLFTMHGSTMMFLFAVPMMEAFAEFLLPVLLGTRELPFPRMTAFLYWILLFGSVMFYASFLVDQVPNVGWFAYTPLSNIQFSPNLGVDFWLLGLDVAQVAALGDGVELLVAILKMKAPGMSINRMPVYLWSIAVMACMLFFGFTPLIAVTLLLQLDRHWGTHFFDPNAGGDPLLWQHLFWIFGHPDVYVMFIPATGIVSMVVSTFARRPIVGYPLIVLSMVATGFVSFGLWVHHMFATGVSLLGMSFFGAASIAIAIPSGIQVFAWIATLWSGRPFLKPPLLWAVGGIVVFVIGGLTGPMIAIVPFDWQVHDTFFVVAHFHYVLVGGVLFPIFAGLHYWLPKVSGRMLRDKLGYLSFWCVFVGFNVAFFPMHILGLLGMPRRVATYRPDLGWNELNLLSTLGVYLLAIGVLAFIANVVYSFYLARGEPTGRNPYGAGTLDWATESPPPDEGYRVIPIVHSREPLWDQARLDDGDPRTVELVHALERSPTTWRATIVTTVLDGRPEGITRMAGPGHWPFWAGLALLTIFGAELYSIHLVAIVALLALLPITYCWFWPTADEREWARSGRPVVVHGLPVYLSGTAATAWWGTLLMVVVGAVASGCFHFAYFYLRAGATQWPPPGDRPPDLVLAGPGMLALLLAAGCMWLAERGVRRGSQALLVLGLAAGFGLGLLFLGLAAAESTRLGFTADRHAYGSAFYTLAGFQTAAVILGLAIAGFTQLQAWLGYFNRWRFLAVQNTALFWTFIAANGLVTLAVLYLSPHVL